DFDAPVFSFAPEVTYRKVFEFMIETYGQGQDLSGFDYITNVIDLAEIASTFKAGTGIDLGSFQLTDPRSSALTVNNTEAPTVDPNTQLSDQGGGDFLNKEADLNKGGAVFRLDILSDPTKAFNLFVTPLAQQAPVNLFTFSLPDSLLSFHFGAEYVKTFF